jgi:hypothetical protein
VDKATHTATFGGVRFAAIYHLNGWLQNAAKTDTIKENIKKGRNIWISATLPSLIWDYPRKC